MSLRGAAGDEAISRLKYEIALSKTPRNDAEIDMLIDGGGQREKGVDVQIAVDLVVGAYENQYDSALLVSSDTDLIPAIRKVKHKGKKLEYIGFSNRPSHGLIKNATLTKTLSKEDLEKFLPH